MLEYAIRYGWEDFDDAQAAAVRSYILQLAQQAGQQDPPYIRHKIAQLWAEIAKRSWAAEWTDMDELLVRLWQSTLEHQGIVLDVLEQLSEDIFNREDSVAALRGNELGRACVEIFTPADVLAEVLSERDTSNPVRCGDEGWLKRICDWISTCLAQSIETDERYRTCTLKLLATLRAALTWVIPKALLAANALSPLTEALIRDNLQVQLAAVEALLALFSRQGLHDPDFVRLVATMYTPDTVSMLQPVCASAGAVDVSDLDDQKYTLCKKLSELLSHLGSILAQRPDTAAGDNDPASFFNLLYEVLQHPSLVVSIPVLHCWVRLLRGKTIRGIPAVTQLIPPLLQTCSQRLIRYEVLPEDSDDTTYLFLNEDIDTTPERHAFLGNYRRYCVEVVEDIVFNLPVDAMAHILEQAETLFRQLHQSQNDFDVDYYVKYSPTVLRVDAQITVLDAALKGYLKWKSGPGADAEEVRIGMQQSIERWCSTILTLPFDDPEVKKKIIQMMVTASTKALPASTDLAGNLLEYLLNTRVDEDTASSTLNEAARDLERTCSVEMQRLAMTFPDHFMTAYDGLEQRINSIIGERSTNEKQRHGFMAFLFIIIHRNSSLSIDIKVDRLKSMVQPMADEWADPALQKHLSSFEGFCELLGMGQLTDFLAKNHFQDVRDWSAQNLSDEGKELQSTIASRIEVLPLRLTKTLLAASTEKLHSNALFETACSLWQSTIPLILPNLLQLVSFGTAFTNAQTWSYLPLALQAVVKRIFTDRFWQAGISTESRDAFFARVSSSKSTYEGFASTVRGTGRQVRESCYYILVALSRFRDFFYGIPQLPESLASALYSDAQALSAHHFSVLLSASNNLIEGCPPHLRSHFLPPLCSALFSKLNIKIESEWAAIDRQVAQIDGNEDLGNEMKSESILRQLTHSSALLVCDLLDPSRQGPYCTPRPLTQFQSPLIAYTDTPHERQPDPSPSPHTPNTMQMAILSQPTVLEPLLLFTKTLLRSRDTRSCSLTVHTLHKTMHHFRAKTGVRDFICVEMLQAAITSLHEPYFVDVQRDLAGLIAQIIRLDHEMTRSVLLQLPGMAAQTERVDRKLERLVNESSDRQQRAQVLDLLSSVRGRSIHEEGRMERPVQKEKRSKMQEQYMQVEQTANKIERGGSPNLAGVGEMFGADEA